MKLRKKIVVKKRIGPNCEAGYSYIVRATPYDGGSGGGRWIGGRWRDLKVRSKMLPLRQRGNIKFYEVGGLSKFPPRQTKSGYGSGYLSQATFHRRQYAFDIIGIIRQCVAPAFAPFF